MCQSFLCGLQSPYSPPGSTTMRGTDLKTPTCGQSLPSTLSRLTRTSSYRAIHLKPADRHRVRCRCKLVAYCRKNKCARLEIHVASPSATLPIDGPSRSEER